MEEVHLIIAKNLKAFREDKKLSLERVAELTGVSKTMIGQIERGESSPTITTIWKIANGLKIPFTSLIHTPQPEAKIVLGDEIQSLSEDNGKYRVLPYFPYEDDRRFEIYTVEIEKGGFLAADPHREGTEEYLTVFEGELTVRVNNFEYTIGKGDSIRFKADRPHTYHNSGDNLTRLSMVLYYPA
ncbi:helix-turn-helix domain-containing protein [Falsibacillus albus]|uniref:XRE family transcriptional regulator n=1 Tax=Falsibacillus albus TaxID=2478915 RepID=A0A3L7JM25_9BACI|nr:XRE family transcriptional regulator [Falsibacillus albus]RLQ91796.1 XRE family transcriptional regulator [Falsibacillus albus]